MTRREPQKIKRVPVSHAVIYEVNTRVFLNELSRKCGRRVTLATLPDRVIDEWVDLGFDAVWLMGVWKESPAGVAIGSAHPGLQDEYRRALPDFSPQDVIGSPYAIQAYSPSPLLGSKEGLRALRRRLDQRNIGLILDVVANHTACDHAWVIQHPEYYIGGTPGEEVRSPEYFFKVRTKRGERVIAHGRDPYFPGWTDTAQLNIMHPGARSAIINELKRIAGLCDGVRCDMAMLLLQTVFLRTWAGRTGPPDPSMMEEFWKEAVAAVKFSRPGFLFIGEAYWGLEWQLQQIGFDYTYDKVLYDRLLREGAISVREHLKAPMDFQKKSVRFIENHDEPRAAAAFPNEAMAHAAAVLVTTLPGMTLLHEGQLEGRKVRVPVQLKRRREESVSQPTMMFYSRLLRAVSSDVFQSGTWTLLEARSAWQTNPTWQNFIAFWWEAGNERRLVVVNYAPHSGQCLLNLPVQSGSAAGYEFKDLMSDAVYVRDVQGLVAKGMFFDLPGYGFHIFNVVPQSPR